MAYWLSNTSALLFLLEQSLISDDVTPANPARRPPKALALRVQLASLIGLLIGHSTIVDDSLANSGILGSLTDGLRDKQEKVRRFSMAALGELLFYISTQNADCRDNNPIESPSKDNRTSVGWQVAK
ncbi:unnamed protein product [Lupinus luteus]|uniref:Uncharacterized protein n=1 Tax=Lupinus luteus TaxID=3873 RepID=A0AAV1YBD4_LUPLU